MTSVLDRFRETFCFSVAAVFLLSATSASYSQDFPTRPIVMVVPYAAGGLADGTARIVADAAGAALGQNIVVENRTGAGGVIGIESMMQSTPDGYTIGWVNRPLLVFRATMDAEFEAVPGENYTPLALATESPFVFATHPNAPFASIPEMIEYARSEPGALIYGSPGIATGGHLAVELLQFLSEIEATHAPYQGEAPALADLLGGNIDLVVGGAPTQAHIEAGTLVALGTTLEQRWDLLPDVPTVSEAGVDGYTFSTWIGFAAPAGLPDSVADILSDAIITAIQDPAVRERLEGMGLVVNALGGSDFQSYIEEDLEIWQQVVDSSGLTMN